MKPINSYLMVEPIEAKYQESIIPDEFKTTDLSLFKQYKLISSGEQEGFEEVASVIADSRMVEMYKTPMGKRLFFVKAQFVVASLNEILE